MIARILALGALYLAGVGAAAQVAKIIPVFGYLQTSLALDLSDVTLIMSAIGFSAIAFGAIIGRIAIGFGLWRMLLLAAALSIVAGLILPSMTGLGSLLIVRVLEGLGHIVIVTTAPTLMISLVAKEKAGVVLGLWASFFGVAFAATQLFALSELNVTHPETFLLWHVVLFVPVLAICGARLRSGAITAPERVQLRGLSLLPVGLNKGQVFVSLAFLFHAGVFTTMLAFAQSRIGGNQGALIAPVLPLVSLAFVFVSSSFLAIRSSKTVFAAGALGLSLGLALALFEPIYGYLMAFAGIGVMQSSIFARIGELCASERETSLMNSAFTQLGNLGNVVIPFAMSLIISASQGLAVEYYLIVIVAMAMTLQLNTHTGTRVEV